MLTLFTDGSSVRGNPGDAAGAYVIMRDSQLLEGLGVPLGKGTNNVGELMAAVNGLAACLRYLNKGEEVLLVSDSLYLLNGLPYADMYGREPDRANSDLWGRLYSALLRLHDMDSSVRTYWVRGHDANEGNVLCDKLANAAAKDQRHKRPRQNGRRKAADEDRQGHMPEARV